LHAADSQSASATTSRRSFDLLAQAPNYADQKIMLTKFSAMRREACQRVFEST
jgi:hypothetical protein